MATKKELIKQYEDGELKEFAIRGISNSSSIVLISIEYGIEDKVFGYYGYGDNKDYFLVKIYYDDADYFKVGKMKVLMNDCMKIR